ncbi:MAG: DUF1549 and DUF1553 domain-containing protein [Verrucomicrobiales bacterium]
MIPRSSWLQIAVLLCASILSASDEDHWSFQPIVAPAVPDAGRADLAESPVDAFVLAKLESENLAPSPEASPAVLLRRLHLDLTGLLPSPETISRFEKAWGADPEAAYGAMVDELLASPHFGEYWARHWLDLARYGDSDGYLGDTLRPWAWIYRDWVIDAVNRDQPFDRFSIEQLAGDLLPDATRDQKIAAGFHRNNLKNTEAGADRELDRTQRVVNRVGTTGTVWLGLSVACAECHDHKHDPISHKEFFELYAFFNNTEDADISVRFEEEWEAYEKKRAAWEADLVALEEKLEAYDSSAPAAPPSETAWEPVLPDKAEAAATDLSVEDDGSVLASGKTPATITYFVEAPIDEKRSVAGIRLETKGAFGTGRELGSTVGRGKDGEFVLSTMTVELIVDGETTRLPLASAKADHRDGQDPGKVLDSSPEGWRVATRTHQPHAIVFDLAEAAELPAGARLKFTLRQKFGKENSMRHFRISTTADPGPLEPGVETVDPKWAELRLPIEKKLASPPAKPATKAQSLVELEGSKRRETFIHERGDYARPGDKVAPATPAVLHPMKEEGERDRLALARWLFDRDNPLTARVTVNRIWQHLFGQGIVSTSDDFGTHGADPSHPELLDWLAVEFQRNGWSRKQLIRSLVMSSTYRQASTNTNPEIANNLLWRQNSFRVPAESVRDIHLVASGLLEPKVGGPGVHPPLPEFVSAVGRSVKWPESKGADRYRRGLYIFLKRTVLYPMLTVFDAPDTSSACSRRERTNSPMQALTLLNDPVFYECAETLGRDLHAAHGGETDAAIEDLVRRCLNREPNAGELATLASAHDDMLRSAGEPELAMIATARIVMNLDEFVTRD